MSAMDWAWVGAVMTLGCTLSFFVGVLLTAAGKFGPKDDDPTQEAGDAGLSLERSPCFARHDETTRR